MPNAPLSRLKRSSTEDKNWAFDLGKTMSSAQAREQIKERLGIELNWDAQYATFRSWFWRILQMQRHSELSNEAVRQFVKVANGASLRAYALKRLHAMSDMLADPKMAMEVVRIELEEEKLRIHREIETQKIAMREKEISLDRERFEWSAAEAAMKAWSDIKIIAADGDMTNAQKIQAVRLKLFGTIAE